MTSYWNEMIYNSGDFFLPKPIKTILDKNIYVNSNYSFYINGWTIIHFISGIIIGYLFYNTNCYFYKMFIIHSIWEFWQIIIGMSKPYNLKGDSNLLDLFIDTIVFMLGTYIIKNDLKF